MLKKLLQLSVMTCASIPVCALAQQQAPSPPPNVIAAAISAFEEYDQGTSFASILKSGSTLPKVVVIPQSHDPAPGGAALNAPLYPNPHIARLAAKSDMVIRGVPLARWTYPLEKRAFTVSIYLVRVDSRTIGHPTTVGEGSLIYVARAGGPVVFQGQEFRGIDPHFQLFHLNEPYVFFGRSLTGNLFKVDSDQVLKISGNQVSEASDRGTYKEYYAKRHVEDVLSEALTAKAQMTPQNKEQR